MSTPSPRYPYVHVLVSESDAELVSLELWELGATGIEERDASTMNATEDAALLTLVANFPEQASANAAAAVLGERFSARVVFVEGDAWRDGWKAYFKPSRIGKRLVVRPSWESFELQHGDVELVLDPGGAFGTGTHETTRLVLEAIQDHLQPGAHVLDVGCGSGILAIACLLLGAERARCIDVDAEAVRATRENAEINAVQARLHVSDDPLAAIQARYPLVLANIESRVLIPLANQLGVRVRPGGVLILSGILAVERERMLAAYSTFIPLAVLAQGEWIALVLQQVTDGP
jgi:ribosomal protein L11 methyltransferase